ncbi:hypothetical protein ARMA_2540 [Ardenticatena maritima]|uniref:Uncharacterized protein n=1 Tax=Ardenticatena maritima TaxID=872965 RepID=A0A0M9UDK4_9CHLR|nr:hypothetical protein ARMA_2540 [Ardenticatena maritima]
MIDTMKLFRPHHPARFCPDQMTRLPHFTPTQAIIPSREPPSLR